jgi:raffinose/stachyose/melibiose transport system permease protein
LEIVKSNTPILKNEKQGINKKRDKKILFYLILLIYSIANIYPIIWMIINSFKTEQEFSLNKFNLPSVFRWENYVSAWESANFSTFFFNSAVISGISTIATVFLGAIAAYFISRFDFKYKKVIYTIFVFGMLIPIHATLLPVFLLMKNLGIINTYASLILPYIAFNLPITIYILVSFMNSLPKEIEESAVMDGCGIYRVFWSIILPMSRPALATVAILNFIHHWNEFSFALVLISDPDIKTLPLGLATFAGEYTANYVTQMAGLTMALVPTIVIYLLMEKHLVKGMTAGAVKG